MRSRERRILYIDNNINIDDYPKTKEWLLNFKEALDKLSNIGLSSDNDNILIEKTDGFFASAKLEYVSRDNTLIFRYLAKRKSVSSLIA